MTDYRAMFDREFLGPWDLGGRDVVVVIDSVRAETLVAQGSKKTKKPVLRFRGKDRSLPLNKTNAKALAAMFGNDTARWIGRAITIYPTTTSFGGETKDCIRIRPTPPPQPRGDGQAQQPQSPAREPGEN